MDLSVLVVYGIYLCFVLVYYCFLVFIIKQVELIICDKIVNFQNQVIIWVQFSYLVYYDEMVSYCQFVS